MMFIFVSTDDPIGSENNTSTVFQNDSMFHALGLNQMADASELRGMVVFQGLLAADMIGEMNDVCMWKGVTCIRNRIRSIEWSYPINLKYLAIGWIPHTTQTLIFTNLQRVKKSLLDTRVLPRELQSFTIESCRWQGSLDMTTLPSHLESFSSSHNWFSGEIRLTDLPTTLKTIRLAYSWSGTLIIDNSAIPKGFHEMKCIHTERIRAIEIHGDTINSRIQVYRFNARRNTMNQVKI